MKHDMTQTHTKYHLHCFWEQNSSYVIEQNIIKLMIPKSEKIYTIKMTWLAFIGALREKIADKTIRMTVIKYEIMCQKEHHTHDA